MNYSNASTTQGTSPAIKVAPWLKNHPLLCLKDKAHMNCDVIFGSPSADCRGTGVCKITARKKGLTQRSGRDCRANAGIAIAKPDGQGIEILLMREALCVNALRRHLSGSTLVVKEPCTLPETLVTALGLKFNTLLPGHYPIESGRNWFKVHYHQNSHFITN